MTSVPKAKGRRDYGVAARGRAAKPDIGGGVPFARRAFFGLAGMLPLQTACRCVCRGGRIGHVRYRISRHVRYRPGCFDFHAGGSIVGQMTFGLAPRSAGGMEKPLVKVRLASGFSYVHEGSVDRADLVDEPRAVEIAQLGADGVGRFAVDHADEQATKQRYLARYLSGPFSFIWRLNVAK